jgi:hypothetical protein
MRCVCILQIDVHESQITISPTALPMQWLQIFTAVSPQTVRTSVATERLLVEATRQFCVMTEQLLRLRVAKTALAKSGVYI